MPFVKICGLTSLIDAQAALDAGADLLGFICYPPSPRYLTPTAIAAILAALRPAASSLQPRTVGVFVNASLESVRQTLVATGLDLAQLHGAEPPEMLAGLHGRAFKALRPVDLTTAEEEAGRFASLAPSAGPDLLIDAYHPQAYGGTGHRADWEIAAALARPHRLLLAGGLVPDNVAAAIAQVRPWGVDVSSGIEAAPGQKDHAKMRDFINAAKMATSDPFP